MRLVTDDPMEFLIWMGYSALGIAAFFAILFLIAWIQTLRGK